MSNTCVTCKFWKNQQMLLNYKTDIGFCINPGFAFSTTSGRQVGVIDIQNLRDRTKITGNPAHDFETGDYSGVKPTRYLLQTGQAFGCNCYENKIPQDQKNTERNLDKNAIIITPEEAGILEAHEVIITNKGTKGMRPGVTKYFWEIKPTNGKTIMAYGNLMVHSDYPNEISVWSPASSTSNYIEKVFGNFDEFLKLAYKKYLINATKQ